jgi:ATP synthase protein I
MFVLPVILGTYLGHWLDGQSGDYSVRWTVGLLLAGVAVGALNVYLFIKE